MNNCNGSCSNENCSNPDRLPPGMLTQYDLNQETALGTLIWAETISDKDGIHIHKSVPEIIGKAKELSDDRLFAIIFGSVDVKPLYNELFSYGIDSLYHIRNKDLETYHPEAYAEAITDLVDRIKPATILISGTPRGREVAPLTAAMLQTGLTADCTALTSNGRQLIMTRPAFGGNILATISCNKFPQMATVRPGTFKPPEPKIERKGTAISRPFTPSRLKQIVNLENENDNFIDITDADILISLGNGIKDRSTIEEAEQLAKKMGAKVSCSRALVEKGWFPHSRQVGQSGRNVSPKLYLAFGISGSVQHKAGIHADKVVAINDDPDAPIHEIADVSIIGNASEIIRKMNSQFHH